MNGILTKKVYKIGYRSGQTLTVLEEIKLFCEMYSKIGDDLNSIFDDTLTEEEIISMNKEFYERYPELKKWLDLICKKSCDEILVEKPMKCLPLPTKVSRS